MEARGFNVDNLALGEDNLFWGMQFAPFSHKTALNGRPSPISLVLRKNGAKPHRHYFDCRLSQNPYDSLLFLSLQESA